MSNPPPVEISAVDPAPERARIRKKSPRPWRRRMYKKVLGHLALGIGAVVRFVPAPVAAPLGRFWGRIGGLLARRDRKLAEANVRAALGDRLDAPACRRVVRSAFANIGASAAELLVAHRNPDWILQHVRVEGLAHLDAALAEGRGVVWITGHCGNWELMPMKIAQLGYPVNVVATTIRYPLLNQAMIDFRARFGVRTVERGSMQATRKMLRAFRNNELLGLLIDHDTRVPSVSVPFFGRPARTPVGAAELSLRFGAPVVPGFTVRERRHHRVVIQPPIHPPANVSKSDAPQVAARLTAEYTSIIERHINRHPADWAWMHKRWADVAGR